MTLGIILIVLAIGIIIFLLILDSKNDGIFAAGCAGGLAVLFMFTGIDVLTPDMTPMDVYQGKTTLKYEVVDGVKVDSTVVWKEKNSTLYYD